MNSFYTLEFPRPKIQTAVAVGFFDGIHLGHQAVIDAAIAQQHNDLMPAVFTFTMHHGHPSGKPADGYGLITDREKEQLLSNRGVGILLCPEFVDFCSYSPEQFVGEILHDRLNAKVVCCGEDYRFGAKAAGNMQTMRSLCSRLDMEVIAVPQVLYEGERISSSRIRALLRKGDVATAAKLLGRPFGFDFPVEQGKQLGRRLGFPTINQSLPKAYVSVEKGVYASLVFVDGKWTRSMTNVGVRPTVEQTDSLCAETYIPDFSGDLYGKHVSVRLVAFIRPEIKFASVPALQEQIMKDVNTISAMDLPWESSYQLEE